MDAKIIFIWSFLLAIQISLVLSAAQCKKQLTPDSNKKLDFQPMEEKIQPVTISTKYNAKGLQPFFNLANSFMNTVQGKKLSEEFKGYDLDDITSTENRDKLMKYETPVIIAASFGVLFMILMPFIGLFFCCCRCCGKCGGKRYQNQKAAERHFVCKFMTACLFIVSVMMLCGCMFMFVTNTRTHDTAQTISDKYVDAVGSVESIANSTKNILNDEIAGNFVPCLVNVIKSELGHHGIDSNIGNLLRDFVIANVSVPFNTAESIAATVDSLKSNLDAIKSKSDNLKSNGTILKNQLNMIKANLDAARPDCKGDRNCENFIDDVKSKTNMNVNFDELPDIQSSIDDIKVVQDKNLTQQIKTGRDTVNNIPKTVRDKSKSKVDEIISTIDGIQDDVEAEVNKITKSVDDAITTQQATWKDYKKYFDKSSEYFKYEDYRSYAYVGLSALMAFIVILLFGGLALGICGYNKDVSPSHRSKTATCGGNCLMASVGFMFIFSFFLMLFCTLWYTVGIHLHFICRDLKDASIFDTIIADKLILQLEPNGAKASVQSTLKNCRSDLPLFKSIGGSKVFNLSSKLDFKGFADNIDEKLADITINLGDQTIMTQEIKDALQKLETSNVDSINFTKFFTTLESSITSYNLTELANNITSKTSFPSDVKTKLKTIAATLKDIDSNTIPEIINKANNLKPDVTQLQTLALHLKGKAGNLLTELTASDYFLQQKTAPKIVSLLVTFAAMIVDYLLQATDFVINQANSNLLRCKPVADLYDGLFSTLLCDDVVQNANGFWLALGWCLLFFVPAIILSVKLAKYFKRMEYDSGLDEFEHPPFNDKIPLQTYESAEGQNNSRSSLHVHDRPDYGAGEQSLMADDFDYDHNPPPPYQNQGYANH